MVSLFRYRKLYADLISPQGDVCVAYVTWLNLLGATQQTAGYEWYPHSGERRVVRATSPAETEMANGNVRIRFDTPQGAFALMLRSDWVPEHETRAVAPRLRWRVVADRAEGVLQSPFASELRGQSYADFVEMTAPPRALGLRSLEWGRSHTPAERVVFTCAVFRDGREFCYGMNSGVSLHNQRVLHTGPALDAARFPSRLERMFVRACSGRIEETRWLAQATFANGATAPAVHERVHFLE